jgi:hypothetical protein
VLETAYIIEGRRRQAVEDILVGHRRTTAAAEQRTQHRWHEKHHRAGRAAAANGISGIKRQHLALKIHGKKKKKKKKKAAARLQ